MVVAGGGEVVQQRAERGGDGAGRVAEPQPGLAGVVAGQVGGGQPQDAAERLGVEQHQAGGGAGPDRDGRVSGEAAQQVQAALLGDDLPGIGLLAGDVQVAGDVTVCGSPDQERTGAFALVGAVAGVVAVDVVTFGSLLPRDRVRRRLSRSGWLTCSRIGLLAESIMALITTGRTMSGRCGDPRIIWSMPGSAGAVSAIDGPTQG
jgi:hypothetical protein